jgi:hypothetical protein
LRCPTVTLTTNPIPGFFDQNCAVLPKTDPAHPIAFWELCRRKREAFVKHWMNGSDLPVQSFQEVRLWLHKGIRPLLSGRVNRRKQSLGPKDYELIGFHSLRTFVAVAKGAGGVQYGTKPVPIAGGRRPQRTPEAIPDRAHEDVANQFAGQQPKTLRLIAL